MKKEGNIFYMIDSAIILSAGYSKRLRPLSFFVPKPLIKIKGKPIIFHIFDKLKEAGVKKFYVNLFYKKEKIEKILLNSEYKDMIFIYREKELMGTGGGIKNFEKYIKGDFIVHNCDIYHEIDLKDFINFHFKEGGTCTMLLTYMKTKSQIIIENNLIKDIKIHKKKGKFLTYAGISIFKKEIFKYLPEGKSDLLNVFYKLIKENKLKGYALKNEKIIDIGTFEGVWALLKY